MARLSGHGDSVPQAVFSPDSMQVATVSRDTKTRLWRIRTVADVIELLKN
jgi:WD40 repeat protein